MTWTQTGMQTSFYEMISKIFITRLKVYLDKILGCRNTRDNNLTTRLTDWVEGWDGISSIASKTSRKWLTVAIFRKWQDSNDWHG